MYDNPGVLAILRDKVHPLHEHAEQGRLLLYQRAAALESEPLKGEPGHAELQERKRRMDTFQRHTDMGGDKYIKLGGGAIRNRPDMLGRRGRGLFGLR